MPITCQDIHLSITSGGQELVPYGIERDDAQSAVAAYIASTAGEEFTITVRSQHCQLLVARVYLDGWLARRVHTENPWQKEIIFEYARISDTLLAPMRFSEYALVDSDDPTAVHDTQDLGTIKVIVFRANYGPEVRKAKPKRQKPGRPSGFLDAGEYQTTDYSRVAETSKKAGGHRIVFDCAAAKRVPLHSSGSSGKASGSKQASRRKVIRETDPLCTFKLFYQPKDLLIAKGIIPRPLVSSQPSQQTPHETPARGTKRKGSAALDATEPAMVASGSQMNKRIKICEDSPAHFANQDDKEEEDVKPRVDEFESDDERDERIQALEAELSALRTARQKSPRVKRERRPSPIRVGSSLRGEVIDLTGDD